MGSGDWLIVGLDGDILIDGQPVDGPGLERGMVFQDHRLFPWLTVTLVAARRHGLSCRDYPIWLRPELLARYRPASARFRAGSRLGSGASHSATPTDTVGATGKTGVQAPPVAGRSAGSSCVARSVVPAEIAC